MSSVAGASTVAASISEGAAMIVWINGAFGGGKTTLAEELHRRLPDAMPFDPEYVGFILRDWVPAPDSGDFQDIPLWRKLVAEFAISMSAEYGRPLIVPMTLVNPDYREEIFGLISKAGDVVLHVFLDVPAAALYSQTVESQISTPARTSRTTFSQISFASPRLRCREIPPTWISTSPVAAARARAGAIPVSGGRISPSAPSTSSTPMVRTSLSGTASIQPIIGRS
jgi:hypothetical protein